VPSTNTPPRRLRSPRPSRIDVRSEHPAGLRRVGPLRRSAVRFLRTLELSGVELSVLVTTDRGIRALNRTWRRKDRPTDVLSFPAGAPLPGSTGPRPLGDVILSLDTARRAARAHRRTLASELDLYLAHGLLHLLGHDHHRAADARRMGALEARLLGGPGMVQGAPGAR
jgi:probable rRNA maturation factor